MNRLLFPPLVRGPPFRCVPLCQTAPIMNRAPPLRKRPFSFISPPERCRMLRGSPSEHFASPLVSRAAIPLFSRKPPPFLWRCASPSAQYDRLGNRISLVPPGPLFFLYRKTPAIPPPSFRWHQEITRILPTLSIAFPSMLYMMSVPPIPFARERCRL